MHKIDPTQNEMMRLEIFLSKPLLFRWGHYVGLRGRMFSHGGGEKCVEKRVDVVRFAAAAATFNLKMRGRERKREDLV